MTMRGTYVLRVDTTLCGERGSERDRRIGSSYIEVPLVQRDNNSNDPNPNPALQLYIQSLSPVGNTFPSIDPHSAARSP